MSHGLSPRVKYRRHERGAVFTISILILGALAAIVATSLQRTQTAAKIKVSAREVAAENVLKRSILNLAMLKVKNYAWEPGQSVADLLPTNNDRFKTWYSDSYEGVSYSVTVADNSDETTGSQDYRTDVDNKVYVRVAANYPSGPRTTQILMSPGKAASAGTEPPGGLPGGIGVCYGWLNFITLMSMNSSSTISGLDTTPDGLGGCSTSGGCPGGQDQFGVATTSWLGSWELGTLFDLGSYGHQGDVLGKQCEFQGGCQSDPAQSYGRPTVEECDNFDKLQELADNMLAANDPNLSLYQQNWGTKNVYGDLVFGTPSQPETVYIKSGIFGRVKFHGEVSGYGILVADGNVKFDDDFSWTGVVINDANALGNIMVFDEESTVNGAIMINRPILSTEIGSVSMDLNFSSGDEANITYSSFVVNDVLTKMDPNYQPPGGGSAGQGFSIAAVQDI